MSSLVFKLRNVPEDEAEEVRALLNEHRIEFYETTAGNWGIGMPGIWVPEEDVQTTRTLINEYQQSRAEDQRSQYRHSTEQGTASPWYSQFVKHPLGTTGIVLFCLFIVYALLSPFIRLALAD